jgi:hypothetical protein
MRDAERLPAVPETQAGTSPNMAHKMQRLHCCDPRYYQSISETEW